MQSEERFRNALGGYNKEDVNRYIKETDLANAARLDTLQKQMDELSENLDKARRENEELVRAFLAAHPDYAPEPMALPQPLPENDGMQLLLPGQYDTDGFFIARLRRQG